jgi:heme iron utilization protein
MNAPPDPATASSEARAQAKRLLRLARTGALATLDRATGAPLTTLVSVASDCDGAPLLLLSSLAAHTKNLAADRRASLLLTSPSGRGDPLNRPRLTLGGPIGPHLQPSARARFLARNPKSKLYASFGDFSIFRMEIQAVHFNGGFARAAALAPGEILTDLAGAERLIAAERTLIEQINAGGDKLARLVDARDGGGARAWRAIGLDPEGLDLAAGSRVARVNFDAPALEPRSWSAALQACLAARGS